MAQNKDSKQSQTQPDYYIQNPIEIRKSPNKLTAKK